MVSVATWALFASLCSMLMPQLENSNFNSNCPLLTLFFPPDNLQTIGILSMNRWEKVPNNKNSGCCSSSRLHHLHTLSRGWTDSQDTAARGNCPFWSSLLLCVSTIQINSPIDRHFSSCAVNNVLWNSFFSGNSRERLNFCLRISGRHEMFSALFENLLPPTHFPPELFRPRDSFSLLSPTSHSLIIDFRFHPVFSIFQFQLWEMDDLADCREVFAYFDSKGDERISVQQVFNSIFYFFNPKFIFQVGDVLRALGQNPTEAEIHKCVGSFDREARLSFEDFVPIFQSVSKNRFVANFQLINFNFYIISVKSTPLRSSSRGCRISTRRETEWSMSQSSDTCSPLLVGFWVNIIKKLIYK